MLKEVDRALAKPAKNKVAVVGYTPTHQRVRQGLLGTFRSCTGGLEGMVAKFPESMFTGRRQSYFVLCRRRQGDVLKKLGSGSGDW